MPQVKTKWPTAPVSAPSSDDDDEIFIDWRKLIISAFVIFQISAIVFWLLMSSSESALGHLIITEPVRRYMLFSGTWQNWSMFAPNPANIDVYLTADVTYQNGHHAEYEFPRMYKLGILQKYQEERFRKMIENGHTDANRQCWPFIARFA